MSDYPFRLRPFEFPAREAVATRPKRRVWLHLLLFVLTVVTTLAVGAHFDFNYRHNQPAVNVEQSLNPFVDLLRYPTLLLNGLPFSLALLTILMAHEMGHYVACRYHGIAASYPYFIPAPTIIGTMGAFIRIRSPIISRRALFDVGISGPLVGFVVAMPILIGGMLFSKTLPASTFYEPLAFGNPMLINILHSVLFPGTGDEVLYLHPVARAAWVGLFATALNLLPIGQLDGGHILYAVVGEKHKLLSRIFLLMLIPLGYLWVGWIMWSVLLFFLGMRHPAIFDPMPLDRERRWLAAVALVIFLLCFTPSPFIAN